MAAIEGPGFCIVQKNRKDKSLVSKKLTHTHAQLFYGCLDFVQDSPGEPLPAEETFTHLHLSWSSVIRYLLPPSIMIRGILSVHFMCLTVFFLNLQVFFGLPLILAPSTSYSIHFFTQLLSSFHNTCPYHRSLFCCITEIFI